MVALYLQVVICSPMPRRRQIRPGCVRRIADPVIVAGSLGEHIRQALDAASEDNDTVAGKINILT